MYDLRRSVVIHRVPVSMACLISVAMFGNGFMMPLSRWTPSTLPFKIITPFHQPRTHKVWTQRLPIIGACAAVHITLPMVLVALPIVYGLDWMIPMMASVFAVEVQSDFADK